MFAREKKKDNGGGGWWSGNYKIPGNQFSGDTFSVYWARFPAVLSSRYNTFMLPTPLPPPPALILVCRNALN